MKGAVTMKKRIQNISLCLMLIMLLTSVFTGCGTKAYGEKIFACSSGNFMGFTGAYLDEENRMTLVFDKWRVMTWSGAHPGLKQIFKDGALPKDSEILVYRRKTEGIRFTSIDIDADEITVDKQNMTISFVIKKDVKAEDIVEFHINTDPGYCAAKFNDPDRDTCVYGDDEKFSYEQIYNESKNSWSKIEKEKLITYDGGPNHTLPG